MPRGEERAIMLALVAAMVMLPHGSHPPAVSQVDLGPTMRQYGLCPRSQGSRGTCSVFAVAGALEYALAEASGNGTPLSVEYLNWASHQCSGRQADGGFFHEIWRGFQRFGICPEEMMPYQAQFTRAEPSQAARDAAARALAVPLKIVWIKEWDPSTGLAPEQLASIRRALRGGNPVFCGLRWPRQEQWKERVLQMCPPSEVFDGHSVLLIGYRADAALPGGGGFLIWNSGGGEREGILPYAYAAAYANDAAYIQASKQRKAASR